MASAWCEKCGRQIIEREHKGVNLPGRVERCYGCGKMFCKECNTVHKCPGAKKK